MVNTTLDQKTNTVMKRLGMEAKSGRIYETSPASKMEKRSRALCEQLNSTDFAVGRWLSQVSKFADNAGNRLVYSAISDYIFGLEQRDRLITNIKQAVNVVYEKKSDGKYYTASTQKMAVKRYDHINLAIRQKDMTAKSDSDLRKQIEEIVETKSADVTKEMTTQLVSLIAIFTALSFIVFGGISSLDSIFQSLQATMSEKNTIIPTLIVADAWALCLMNLLFGFMYFVLRITGLPKPVNENAKNLVQRYPVVFLCDYVLIVALVIFCGIWFFECNGLGKDAFSFAMKHHEATFGIALAVALFIFVCAGIFLHRLYTRKSSSKQNNVK